MMMMISKVDNSVWDFGGLPPTLSACIKRKASIWHTRWFIFVMPEEKKKLWKTERHVPTDTNSLVFKLCYKHFFLYRRLMLLCIKKEFKKWTLKARSRLNLNVFFFEKTEFPNYLRSFTSSNSIIFPNFWPTIAQQGKAPHRLHSACVSSWLRTWQVDHPLFPDVF